MVFISVSKRIHKILPYKLLHTIIVSFLIVLTPTTIALVYTSMKLQSFSSDYILTLNKTRLVSIQSQELWDLILDMERSARQYLVVKDDTLISNFEFIKKRFNKKIQSLIKQLPNTSIIINLQTIDSKVNYINQLFSRVEIVAQSDQVFTSNFHKTRKQIKYVMDQIRVWSNQQIIRMEDKVNSIRNKIFIQIVLIFPLTGLLILVLLYFINKPLAQLNKAILSLGKERFNQKIEVEGPQDFIELGDELERLRIRLKVLEENNQKFLRHMSHELKTPLSSLKEGLDLLLDKVPGNINESQLEIITILQNNTYDLKMSIENVIEYSKLKMDITIVPSIINLNQTLNEIIQRQKIRILHKKLKVLFQGSESLDFIGDVNKITSAFENLISNAINYSPEGGKISLVWEQIEDQIQLDVIDDGPGVDLKEKEIIFKLFCQGEQTREGSIKGSGIGLSIVKEAVHAHQGHVEVDNCSGRGALFRIYLPANQ